MQQNIDPVQWSGQGVFLFKNPHTKQVLLQYSNDCLKALAYKLKKYMYIKSEKDLIDSPETLLEFVPASSSDECLMVHSWLGERYEKEGYTLLGKKRQPFIPKVVCFFYRNKIRAAVVLQGGANKKITVGVFNKMADAVFFKKRNYPNDLVLGLIYSEDELTKEYIKYLER